MLRKGNIVQSGVFLPAGGADQTVLGVDANGNALRTIFCHGLPDKLRVGHGGGADHRPPDAQAEHRLQVRHGPDAAQLDTQSNLGHGLDDGAVFPFAVTGTVQVYHVEIPCAGGAEGLCGLYRVVRHLMDGIEATLVEADDFAVF